MRVLVGTGADRIRIMLGKLGTLVLCVLLIMAVGMVLTLAGGFATRYALGKEPSVDWSFNSDFFIDLLRILGIVLLSLLLGTAISFALGVLSRSQALAIAGTLIFFSLEGVVTALLGFLGGIGDVIAQVLLDKNQARLNEYMQFNPNVGSGINPWQALAVTIAWIVVPVLIALWVFRKQEITSGA
jgi:ABC-type transport system involved in multi-copper enzyme maturation permease subunit